MTMFTRTLVRTVAAGAIGAVLATSAFAQSAREIRGASPYEEVANEPAARLTVDPPFPGPLAQGIFQAQYRVENVRILPVFGAGALTASPRIGHLHITVDDLPWWWADASDNNTVDIAGLPRRAQGEDRAGRRQPQRLPRTGGDGAVHRARQQHNGSQGPPLARRPATGRIAGGRHDRKEIPS